MQQKVTIIYIFIDNSNASVLHVQVYVGGVSLVPPVAGAIIAMILVIIIIVSIILILLRLCITTLHCITTVYGVYAYLIHIHQMEG